MTFQSQGSNTWTGTLEVETSNNSGDETHGVVTVVLDESTTTYTTATAPDNTASVSITDRNTPTISIAAAPDIVEGQFARFKVTSDIEPWKPLGIRYTPTESSTEFLDTTNGASGTTRVANPAVTFTPEGNSFTGTLLVPTQVDSDMDTGTITVQLEDDSNTTQRDYQLTSNSAERSNSVNIVPTPVPELSIITEDFAINEDKTIPIKPIKIQASVNPLRQFPIKFTPTDETGSYLELDLEGNGDGDARTTEIWFTEEPVPDPDNPGQTISIWTAEIMIDTKEDDLRDMPHGLIKVTLNAVAGVNTVSSVSGADHVNITVNDSTKPIIKIGTPPTDIQRVFGNDGAFTIRPITITSDIEPHGNNLTIKFSRAEPNSDFFDPEPVDDEEQTQIINFTTSNSVTSGTMMLSLKDDPDEGSGMITITLLDDPINYKLSDVESEKVTQITAQDPSYIEVNSYTGPDMTHADGHLVVVPVVINQETGATSQGVAKEAFLYVRNPSANFVVNNTSRVLDHETKVLSFSASWYTDDSTTPLGKSEEDFVDVSNGTVTTDFGNWILPMVASADPTDMSDGWGTINAPHYRKNSRFEISSEQIAKIPHGSDGRIELNLGIPNDVTDKSTLHIRHYTSALWNSNDPDPVLTVDRSNKTLLDSRKEATIRTFHDTLSEFSFVSKLYDGVSTSVDANLTEMDVESTWSGDEWTAQVVNHEGTSEENIFGRWIIGNESDCARGAKCLDVRFEPDTSASIGNNIIKVELVITNSGIAETDTLTYFIDGNTITTALEDGDSQTINSPATPIDIDDVAATATIFSRITDTFNIVASETTPNQPNSTKTGANSTDTNMIARFLSKEYGTDLTLGKWYFDEANTGTPRVDEVDSGYQEIMRKVLFKPDPDGIAELPAGATRVSTITINRDRGDKTVATASFSVTINRVNVPGLTITQPEVIIVEGDDLNFTVTSDIQPTTNPLTVSYIVSQPQGSTEGGIYVDTVTEMVDSSRPVPLTFTQMPNSTVWIATLPIALKDADQTNAISGGVKVELDEPDDNTNYFVAGGEGNEASVIVYDKGLPVITIQEVIPVFNETAATLTFVSNIATTEAIALRIKPTNTVGSFLDESAGPNNEDHSSGMVRVISANFSSATADPPLTFSTTISTKMDMAETKGTFSVELLDDNNPVTYGVNQNKKVVTVTVVRVTTLTINSDETEINEGEDLTFTVTSDFQPLDAQNALTTTQSFEYTVSEDTSNFLADPTITTNPISVTDMTFTPVEGTADWETSVTVDLRDRNQLDDGNGEITLTLVQPSPITNNQVDTNPVVFTILEADDPILSIADAELIFNGDEAEFTITSHLDPGIPFSFKARFTDISGSFLNPDGGASGTEREIKLTTETGGFTQIDSEDPTSKFIYTLAVPTQIDAASSSGTIQVELVEDATLAYNLSPIPPAPQTPTDPPARNPNIATVAVYRTPTLSIEPKTSPVNETAELAFIVTANYDPNPNIDPSDTPRPLTINYTITEENGSFVDATVATNTTLSADVTFSQAQGSTAWTAELPIALRQAVDEILTVDGKVKVTLDPTTPDAAYLAVASNTDFPNEASASIDDITIPVISIGGVKEAIAGEDAEIIISSVTEVVDAKAFNIKITPTNVIGNFLATTDDQQQPLGDSGAERIISGITLTTPSESKFTGIAKIPTMNDNATLREGSTDIITSGTIMVVLVDDDSTERKYNISDVAADNTATVSVLRSDLEFALNISDVSTAEGDGGGTTPFVFEVTLSQPLEFPITVNYAFSEYEGTEIPATIDADFAFARDERSLEFLAGQTEKEITVNVIADDTIELTEAFSISLTIMGNSRIDDPDPGIGTIMTDDEPEKPYINVARAEDSVMEGQPAVFNISVRHPPDDERIAVTVDILVEDGGSFIAWRTPRTVKLAADDDSVEVSIPTLDDSTDEEPASVTLTILSNDEVYTIDEANMSDSIEIMDNDDPGDSDTEDRISIAESAVSAILSRLDELLGNSDPAVSTAPVLPAISVVAITPEISEGEAAEFEIISDKISEENLSISFATSQRGDFLAPPPPQPKHKYQVPQREYGSRSKHWMTILLKLTEQLPCNYKMEAFIKFHPNILLRSQYRMQKTAWLERMKSQVALVKFYPKYLTWLVVTL